MVFKNKFCFCVMYRDVFHLKRLIWNFSKQTGLATCVVLKFHQNRVQYDTSAWLSRCDENERGRNNKVSAHKIRIYSVSRLFFILRHFGTKIVVSHRFPVSLFFLIYGHFAPYHAQLMFRKNYGIICIFIFVRSKTSKPKNLSPQC